jgi:hypothetical protein
MGAAAKCASARTFEQEPAEAQQPVQQGAQLLQDEHQQWDAAQRVEDGQQAAGSRLRVQVAIADGREDGQGEEPAGDGWGNCRLLKWIKHCIPEVPTHPRMFPAPVQQHLLVWDQRWWQNT